MCLAHVGQPSERVFRPSVGDVEERFLQVLCDGTGLARANLDVIWKRVNRRDTRPLLKRDNPKQVLADLEAARAPIYAEADIVVESGDGPATDAVKAIRQALGFQ